MEITPQSIHEISVNNDIIRKEHDAGVFYNHLSNCLELLEQMSNVDAGSMNIIKRRNGKEVRLSGLGDNADGTKTLALLISSNDDYFENYQIRIKKRNRTGDSKYIIYNDVHKSQNTLMDNVSDYMTDLVIQAHSASGIS